MATHAFEDRVDAGRRLGRAVAALGHEHPLVVGIAPGGVVVALEVARALGAVMEGWAAQQLEAEGDEAFHAGALAENGHGGYAVERARTSSIPPASLEALAAKQREDLMRRVHTIRHRPRLSMRNHTVVLVDDGLATGATILAAIRAIRQEKPHRIIVALPVAVRDALAHVERYADGALCLHPCDGAEGVCRAYRDFASVTDAHAAELLDCRRLELERGRPSAPTPRPVPH